MRLLLIICISLIAGRANGIEHQFTGNWDVEETHRPHITLVISREEISFFHDGEMVESWRYRMIEKSEKRVIIEILAEGERADRLVRISELTDEQCRMETHWNVDPKIMIRAKIPTRWILTRRRI